MPVKGDVPSELLGDTDSSLGSEAESGGWGGGSGGDYASLSENGVHRQYYLMTQIPVSGLEVGRRVRGGGCMRLFLKVQCIVRTIR